MPRCITSVSPESSSASRYLARRRSAATRRPVSRSTKSLGKRKAQVRRGASRRCASARADQRRRQARGAPSRLRAVQACGWSLITARNAAPYFCSFAAPTPWTPARSSSVCGRLLRHLDQRPVGEDHIGRLVRRRAPSPRATPSVRRADRRRRRAASAAACFARRLGLGCSTSSRSANGASPRSTLRPASVTTSRSRSSRSWSMQLRRQQLPEHAAPVGGRAILADAEGLELVVAVARDRLASPCRRGCWRDGRRRTGPRCAAPPRAPSAPRCAPSTTRTAPLQTSQWPQGPHSSPKNAEQHLPAAARALAERDEVVELARLDPLALVGRVALLDLAAAQLDVAGAVERQRVGGQAVAAGAADLLVIGLDRGRHVGVEHEAHVGLVDAHAEGDRRAHHDAVLLQEDVLVVRAHVVVEPGVIGQRAAPFARRTPRASSSVRLREAQ